MTSSLWLALAAAAAVAAGCTVDDRSYTGPTIAMQLTSNGYDTVEDTDPMPALTLGATDTSYSIAVEILTQAGSMSTRSSERSSQVTGVTASFAVAGQGMPSPDFASDGSVLDPTFKTAMPIVITGSAKGGTLTVHATGVDGDGLASNVIELSVALE